MPRINQIAYNSLRQKTQMIDPDLGTFTYEYDHLSSTTALSDEDGNILAMDQYLPYGGDKNSNDLLQNSSYKFTDQEQDDGTGLYNYDARFYDPVIGQFVMADTFVPDQFNPQSWNRYAYCLNNPLIYVDPTEHEAGDVSGMLGSLQGSHDDFTLSNTDCAELGLTVIGGIVAGFKGSKEGVVMADAFYVNKVLKYKKKVKPIRSKKKRIRR